MNYKRFLAVAGAALMIVIVILIFVPGAWAASNYKVLYRFTGGADGSTPSGVVFDAAGNLYGTTYSGGAYGWGSVFQLTPNPDGTWTQRVLYSFQNTMDDGRNPNAGLVFDAAGNLYGTITCVACGSNDQGGAFVLTPNPDGTWTESTIAFFDWYWSGAPPHAMIFDAAGNIYGTTSEGIDIAGSVYELKAGTAASVSLPSYWQLDVLHRFNWNDGSEPLATLVFDASGNLYGTTSHGGRRGGGNVFRVTPEPGGSWKETAIHNFSGGKDGGLSTASLIFDAAGNLYGTASVGGTYGYGVAFKLTPGPLGGWKERVLHSFKGGQNGASPNSGLVFDTAGNLYGTASAGGLYGYGVVFKLTPGALGGWKERVLHSFEGHPGQNPVSVLVLDSAGNLYGTTKGDGKKTFGSVFEITP